MRKKKSWTCLMALALSVAMLVPSQAAYATEGQAEGEGVETYAEGRVADADGFEIEDGELKKYTGTATEVVIPDEVTSIGMHAFYNCSSLISVTIPEGVTKIGEGAFYGCSSLMSITIPKGVTSIGNRTFQACNSLTMIKVEEGNAKYDSREKCNALIETESNNLIAGCKNTIIPEGVASIGSCAFWGCSGLTGIKIPSSVTNIGGGAFYECSGLTEIVIPKEVTSIGDLVLFGCDSLTSIKVEEGNAKYDSRENCNALIETESNKLIVGCKNTFIPKGVEIIGEKAFYTCDGFTDIIIPEGVTTIGDWAFAVCSSLTSVVVPKGVEYIGSYAFAHCSNLKEINLPEGLTVIGGNAGHTFVNCSSLEEISIPKGVAWIPMGTFMDCNNLKKVNFSEGLELIAGVAFSGCSSLTEISLPEGLVEIRNYVFGDCSSLTSITIPESVTEMEGFIFSGCSKRLTIYGKTGSCAETYANENDILFSSTGISHPIEKKTISSNNVALSQTSYTYDGKAKEPAVTVKDGNTVLKEGTDYTVTYSNNINVGTAKVTVTGKGNYTGTVTKEFTITEAAPEQGVKDLSQCTVMLSKSSYTYDGTAKKPTVTVKDGAAALKEGTDYTVNYSNNINVGTAKVTVAGKGNYKGTVTRSFTITVKKGTSHKVGSCQYKVTGTSAVSVTGVKDNKVTKVKIPKIVKIGGKDFKVTAIGSRAFKNNKKITSVEIGDNVKSIGTSAFEGCTKLSRAALGRGITEISGNAFKDCKKLGTITIKSTKLKKVGRNALKGIKPAAKIKVPARKLSAYKKLFKNKGQGRKVKFLKQ